MVQYVYGKIADRQMVINITPGDLPTAANQTAASVSWTLPAGYAVADAYIQNVGGTITSTGTLSNFYLSYGTAVSGVQYVAQTNLAAAGTVATTIAAAVPGVATTDTTTYITLTPNGSGSNWSTLTYPVGSTATMFTVTIVYRNLAAGGDSLR